MSSQVSEPSNDLDFASATRNVSRACSICGEQGHFRGKCEKLSKYKSLPLQMGANVDLGTRESLADSLTAVNRYVTHNRSLEDKRALSSTFPKNARGVVVHRRLYKSPGVPEYCLECTILDMNCDPDTNYVGCLFLPGCVSTFIRKCRTNIVISKLAELSVQPGTFGNANPFAGISQANSLAGMAQTNPFPGMSQTNPFVGMSQASANGTEIFDNSQAGAFQGMLTHAYGTDMELS